MAEVLTARAPVRILGRTPPRSCGSCDLCCHTYEIPELAKPMGQACGHLRDMRCSIHGAHPRTCKAYRCFWLSAPQLGDEWRPAVAGFVLRLDPDGATMWVDTDPARPGAWREAPYIGQLKSWSWAVKEGRGALLVHDEGGVFVVFPETEIFLPDPPRGARFQAGYRHGIGGPRPWAEVIADGPAKHLHAAA